MEERRHYAARLARSRAGRIVDIEAYLRAAQAYMLISMPTDTSAIFGVFQAIPTSTDLVARLREANLGRG